MSNRPTHTADGVAILPKTRKKQCKLPSRGEDMKPYLMLRKRSKAIARAQARAQCIANAGTVVPNSFGTTSTGTLHNREREFKRRLRQEHRLYDVYMMNGGFSRRGREVGSL